MRILSKSSQFCRDTITILAGIFFFAACERNTEQPARLTSDHAPALPPKLTPAQLAEAATRPGFFFLDVRSSQEIAELGTLPGYVNIPIEELEGRLAEIPPGMAIVTA
jgi:uncharacterized lipoprotein YajG